MVGDKEELSLNLTHKYVGMTFIQHIRIHFVNLGYTYSTQFYTATYPDATPSTTRQNKNRNTQNKVLMSSGTRKHRIRQEKTTSFVIRKSITTPTTTKNI
jgi:hypothetical protein